MSRLVSHVEVPNDLLWGVGPTFCDRTVPASSMADRPTDATCVKCRRRLLRWLKWRAFFGADRKRQVRWIAKLEKSLQGRSGGRA